MEKKTIWYCHHYAGSPSRGMSYRPYYLTREFCNAGHRAFVIGASYHHLLHQPLPQRPGFKTEEIDGVNFILLKTPSYLKNGLGRLLNMFSYVWRLYRHKKEILAYTGKPDVIIVSSSHPFHFRVLEKIARQYNAKLIFEVRDIWPLSLVDVLKLQSWHPLVLWLGLIERHAYRHADYVVSLLDGAFPHMQARGLEEKRFRVIPNGTNIELVCQQQMLSESTLNKIKSLQGEGLFLLGYAGAIGAPNALKYLVSAMVLLAEKKLPIHCVMIGDGGLKVELEQEVNRLGLKNVSFLSFIPKYEIPAFLGEMDALYLGWNAVDVYKYGVSPNKLYDYMMAGKPIIESGGAGHSIIDEVGCGVRCEAANPHAIAEAIVLVSKMSASRKNNMGERGVKIVEALYDYKILAKKYISLF